MVKTVSYDFSPSGFAENKVMKKREDLFIMLV